MKQLIVIIKDGQTLFDLALQLYGDASKVYEIIKNNPSITDITFNSLTGLSIVYEEQKNKESLYFLKENTNICTGYPETGSQFLLQEDKFYLLQENGFKIKL